ncbi:MAG: 50S ribosomal protein L11 methyltransferase [Lachnospiraceae bacterium]|nr:50S ribosomal protein L11 methyltransferase [Lachnospiraceae bacterium]
MKWNKYTIETTTQAEEIVTYTLSELGITNVEIEDKKPLSEADKKKMFVDILPDIEDDGKAYVSFYLELSDDGNDSFDEIIENIESELKSMSEFTDMGSLKITQSVTEDEDWINNWKAYFKPFYIDDILIKPTWEELPKENNYSMYIDIDPGIAFGTGMHETTRLCIRQLRKYVNGDINLLDVGCGSGILSIIGLKLGACRATAIDIDPDATKATLENAEVNGIDMSAYTVFDGNILEDKEIQDKTGYECYDIVVANILADVIIPLQKIIAPHMKKDAILITSGIINTKEEEVKSAIEANDALEIKEITRDGDWVSITAYKK